MAALAILLCWSPGSATTPDAAYHFTLAKVLAEEGEYSEALDHYQKALALEPEDLYSRIEFAELLLRLGRSDRAAKIAQEARTLAPESLDALRVYSQAHLQLAKRSAASLVEARGALEEIRSRDPEDVQSMMSLGQVYLGESRPAEAAEVFAELLTHAQGNRMVYSLLVDSLLRSDQSEAAEKSLQEALAQDPAFLRARLGLAEIRSERGDHSGAVELLESAGPEDHANEEVRRRLALELYRMGEVDRAVRVLDDLLAERPDLPAGLYLKALVLIAQNEMAAARGILERLREQHPGNLEVTYLLAQVHERESHPDRAVAVLSEALGRLDRSSPEVQASRLRMESALVWARAGEWQQVEDLLEPLVGGDGAVGAADLRLLRAEALRRLDRPQEAIAFLEKSETVADDPTPYRAKKAEILLGMEEIEAARAILSELGASKNPGDVLKAVEVYQREELYADAIPLLESVIQIEPDSAQVMFWLAAAYERTSRKEEAAEMFEDVLAIDPQFAPALNYLGYMWAEEGKYLDRALALVQKAVALDPENGAYIDSLGWVHFQLGQYEEARGHLERAAHLVGDDAVVFEHLGDLYLALGQHAEARETYSRALALNADNATQVQEKLDELDR